MRGISREEEQEERMNWLHSEINAGKFFTVLFSMTGWLVVLIILYLFFVQLATPAQFCGYYLQQGQYYQIRAYWRYGFDTTVYSTFDGKEAIEVLKRLNEQVSPLKIQQTRPKDL